MVRSIVLVGGGGHALSVLDTLLAVKSHAVVGIVDPAAQPGATLLGIPVLGGDAVLPSLRQQGVTDACVSVGSIGDTGLRVRLYEMLKDMDFTLPVIQDPTAVVASGCRIGDGTFIGKGAIINALTELDAMVIVNSRAVVEHECRVGAFCHIAPGAILCGNVRVGAHAHIGAGATIIQGTRVGEHTLIGAGSVVVKDIAAQRVAVGIPCREVRNR